ncbi:OmpA family protein [bacterium]|nr:OmpA family protein [bacterium]
MQNRNKVVLCTVLLISLLFSFLQAQDRDLINIPARPIGMGGTFVAIADDGNAPLWNPAGMEQLDWRSLSGTYSRLHWGVENDMLNEGYLGYVHHLGRRGRLGSVGIFWAQFFSDVYSNGTMGLSYAKKIWGKTGGKMVSLGFNGRAIRSALNESNFEDVDPGDPLLENLSKIAPSFDVGLFIRPSRFFDIGLVARNLNEPNIALSGESVDEGKVPMNIRGGVSLHLGSLTPNLEVSYTNNKVDDKQQISTHIGLEQSFFKSFMLRGGFVQGINERQDITVGLGYMKHGDKIKWGFDYGMVYPINDIGKIATTHKFGFSLFFAPPPILLDDLELVKGKVDVYPVNLYEGNSVELKTMVKNMGEKSVSGVKVTAYYQDSTGTWQLCGPIQRVSLKIGEEKEVTLNWTPPHRGTWVVYMAIDDDGTSLPDIHGSIREVDEDNNMGMGQLQTFAMPIGQIQPKDRVLSVSELKLIQEEEPIIPVVFFKQNSSEIDERFDRALRTIAQRMQSNPNAKLFIRGYYSEGSDNMEDNDALALERAEKVRNTLIQYGVDPKYVDIERFGYDYGESRSGQPESQLNTKDRRLQMEENRRAELFISVVGSGEFLTEVLIENEIGSQEESSLLSSLSRIESVLENNNELIIICEGFYANEDGSDRDAAYDRVSNVAKWIKSRLKPAFADRVYFTVSFESWAVPQLVRIYPNAEGIIFRPREGDLVLEDYVLDEESDQNLVQISAFVDAGVDSFAVSIIDEAGQLVRVLAAGKGNIPEGLGWDWRDESGQLLDFEEKYFCKLDITDKLGERFVTTSDTMKIEVTKKATRVERLIIVEFIFNEQKPQSKFLESRVEYVAKHLIMRAEKMPQTLYALVSGHTDSIGAEYANRRLSQERAERELFNLRRYLIYLLDLNTQQDLDRWLDQHNVKLSAKGFWETRPYVISIYSDGKIDKVQIGDNSTPVGRTVNRRVLLELTTEVKKEFVE